MKNVVFLDVTPCDSCKNRSLGGTYSLHHQGYKNRRKGTTLTVTSNRILVTLMMEEIRSSEAKNNVSRN
jgi:hypothetical protein